ncbi:MAG: hypothetical protein ACTSR3_06935 [Candidatus Helarchaeota archaeon]
MKNIALIIFSGMIESMISQDRELARLIGFDGGETLNDSTLKRNFMDLTLEEIQMIQAFQ